MIPETFGLLRLNSWRACALGTLFSESRDRR